MSFGEDIRKITVHIPEKYLILDYTPAYGKEISEGILEWETLGKTGKIKIYYLPFNEKSEKEKFKSGEVKKFQNHIITYPNILTSKKETEIRILMVMPNIKEDFGIIFPIALKDPYDVSIYKLSNFDAIFDDSEEYQQVFDKETISKNKQTFWIEKVSSENIETIYIHLSNSWKSESYLYYIFGLKGSVIPGKATPMSESGRKLKFYEGFIDFGVKFPFSEEDEIVYLNKLYDFKTEELDFSAYFPENIDIKTCEPKESEKQNKKEPKYVKWCFMEENTKRDFNFRIYYEIIDQRDTLRLFQYFFGLVLLFMSSTVFAKLVRRSKEFKKYILVISTILIGVMGSYLITLIIPKNLSEIFSEGYPKTVEIYRALSIICFIVAIFFIYSVFKEKKKTKKRIKGKKRK